MNARTTHGRVHEGSGVFEGLWLVKKDWGKLIGNGFVIAVAKIFLKYFEVIISIYKKIIIIMYNFTLYCVSQNSAKQQN